MEFTKRNELRLKLLKEIYEYYFNNKGTAFKINDKTELDSETKLAYDYLNDKGLVQINYSGQKNMEVKITVYGIDTIESLEFPQENNIKRKIKWKES